jgi:hypothetical protein
LRERTAIDDELFGGLFCTGITKSGLLNAHSRSASRVRRRDALARAAQCHIDRCDNFRSRSTLKDLIQMRR